MREKFSSLAYLGIFLGLVLAFNSVAKDKAPKISNIQGRVQMINKDSSTITIEKGSMRRQVIYSGDTKFLYGHSNNNKPGAADQVKEGNYISCSGTLPHLDRGPAFLPETSCVLPPRNWVAPTSFFPYRPAVRES